MAVPFDESTNELVARMEMTDEELLGYLLRLGFAIDLESVRKLQPTKELLFDIHRRAFEYIPFENLSIYVDGGVDMGLGPMTAKVCSPGATRGGYCFEVNKLLAGALLHIGYEVELRTARVWFDDGKNTRVPYVRQETHMSLLVALPIERQPSVTENRGVLSTSKEEEDDSCGGGGQSADSTKPQCWQRSIQGAWESRGGNPSGRRKAMQQLLGPGIGEFFLCDVGFGRAAPLEPVPLDSVEPLRNGHTTVQLRRIVRETRFGSYVIRELWFLQRPEDDLNPHPRPPETAVSPSPVWRRGFSFYESIPAMPNDFVSMNLEMSAHRESIFVKIPWVESRTQERHARIFGTAFSKTDFRSGIRTSQTIESAEELQRILKDEFDLACGLDDASIILRQALRPKTDHDTTELLVHQARIRTRRLPHTTGGASPERKECDEGKERRQLLSGSGAMFLWASASTACALLLLWSARGFITKRR